MSAPAAPPPVRRAATKQCEICQATFTRKTHLNRHMRSHTNDRSHVCKLCNSQFTRSDLLTRHKKICGGFRSRRKSCQACAKAKSRCDLKTPSCSKCMTLGISCEYVTGPAARKNLTTTPQTIIPYKTAPLSSPFSSSSSSTSSSSRSSFEFDMNNGRRMSPASDASSILFGTDCDSSSICSTPADIWPMSSTADIMTAMNPSLTSVVDNSAAIFNFTDSSLNYEYMGGLNDPNSSDWPNFYNDIFVTTPPPKAGWAVEDMGYSPSDLHLGGAYPFPDSYDNTWNTIDLMQPADLPPQYSPPRTTLDANIVASTPPAVSPQRVPTRLQSVENESAQPPVEHFNFLNQLPLIHTPTWTATDKPEALIKAMQACGALYIRTPESDKFVSDVLKEGRENIMMGFARETNPLNQMYMALALVLIQTVGLFHQSADQRHTTAMYHAMVATIISRSTAFQKLLQWAPPLEIPPTASLDDIWQDWIRVRCLLYLHDCCQSVYFATPQNPSLSVDLYLPSEPALWNARTAQEWYECLQQPSLYGTSSTRLQGVSLQHAWSRLVDQRPAAITTYTSAFGHYILVHCALARIYVHMHAAWDNVEQGGPSKSGTEIYTMQNVLQNWLLNWQCEMRHSYGTDAQSPEIPFAEDALPFYWLGQVSLLTLAEGKERQSAHTIPDVRFRVIKGWLSRIRECLRSNRTAHAQFTHELVQLRSQYTPVEMINVASSPLEVPLNLFHPTPS